MYEPGSLCMRGFRRMYLVKEEVGDGIFGVDFGHAGKVCLSLFEKVLG